MYYSGIVSVITGDFNFTLVDKDTVTVKCYVNLPCLKEVVKLLEIGDAIKVKGIVESHKVDYLRQRVEICVIVNEIIG